MSYQLFWRSPNLQFVQKQTPINVPAGSIISNAASLRLTGKGATNYGKIQQENQLRLLENFAGPSQPDYPTVGQTWYDTANTVLKVCVSTEPFGVVFHSLNSTQITNAGDPPPYPANLGDTWYSRGGTASGILYAYTGIGRYPPVDWSATAATSQVAAYWPPANTTTLAFALSNNTVSLSGYAANVPANVDGSISIDGTVYTVPRGQVITSQPSSSAYVLWDRVGTLVSAVQPTPYFQVRQLPDGQWQFDNGLTWVNFIPTYATNMFLIGTISVAASVVTAATPWVYATHVLDLVQVPATLDKGAVGGWDQQFPTVERAAGRDEYDFMYGLLYELIGDALGYGGSGAVGRSIQYLTNFQTLDASTVQRLKSLSPQDLAVVANGVPVDFFKVEPNSQDWDLLLAAAKYALNRLELPPQYLGNVSEYPFIIDGRQAPAVLQAFPVSDPQYPDLHRMAQRKPGSITLGRFYEQTVNALRAGIQNRYILKGMMGYNSTNPTYSPNVAAKGMAGVFVYTGSVSPGVTHGLQYRFDTTAPETARFFYAGGALTFIISHTAPYAATSADIDLKSLLDTHGKIRVLADQTLVLDGSNQPAITATSALGFQDFSTTGIVLYTITVGTATLTIRGGLAQNAAGAPIAVALYADISTTAATSGTTYVLCGYISDNELYANPAPTLVYPAPLAYVAADKTGPFTETPGGAPTAPERY